MRPHIRYRDNGFLLYPPSNLRGEAAQAFLQFSQDYFRALAKRYGEPVHLEVEGNRLLADLSQAPRTLRAARHLGRQ
jgi:hypothetical protein